MTAMPRSRSTDKRYYGVVSALVTDNRDPEQEGRVKVTYPWFDSQMESNWCRTVQIYAGGGYGAFFVPEIGDEVAVAFMHGDMRLPFVLGGVYNGQDKPATHRAADSEKDEKILHTKGGHQFRLIDTRGKEKIEIITQGGHQAVLNDEEKKVTVETTAGNRVTMHDNGSKIEIQTAGSASIVLDGASGSVTITGSSSVTVDAAQIKLGQAASQSLVLGEALLALFNAHVHTSTAPGVPTSPPLTPMTPAQLSMVSKTA